MRYKPEQQRVIFEQTVSGGKTHYITKLNQGASDVRNNSTRKRERASIGRLF